MFLVSLSSFSNAKYDTFVSSDLPGVASISGPHFVSLNSNSEFECVSSEGNINIIHKEEKFTRLFLQLTQRL